MYVRLLHNIICNNVGVYDRATTSVANFLHRKITSKIPEPILETVDKVLFVFEKHLPEIVLMISTFYAGLYLQAEVAHIGLMVLGMGMWVAYDLIHSAQYYPYQYLENVNKESKQGKLKAVVSRPDDLKKIRTYLATKECNNVLLIGKAGSGKTTLVDDLTNWIESPNCPPELAGKQVLRLNLALLKANAREVGAYEARLLYVLNAVKMKPSKYILFIDEIHLIAMEQKGKLANMLKPYLALGLRCIGATTPYEHKKFIEDDEGIGRRFNDLYVQDSDKDCAEILVSRFPHLKLSKEAIAHTMKVSSEVYPKYALPDRAIKLLRNVEADLKVNKREIVINKDNIDEVVRVLHSRPPEQREIKPEEYRKKVLESLTKIHETVAAAPRGGGGILQRFGIA